MVSNRDQSSVALCLHLMNSPMTTQYLLTHYHLHSKQAIAGFPTGKYHKMIIQFLLQFLKIHFVKTIDSELLTNILSQLKNKSFL